MLESNSVAITWELIRNVDRLPGATPKLLNQTLHLYVHLSLRSTGLWYPLSCRRKPPQCWDPILSSRSPEPSTMHGTQWEFKSCPTNKWISEPPTCQWIGKNNSCGPLAFNYCDIVGPRVAEEVYTLHSVTRRTSGSLLLGLHLVSLRYPLLQQSINQSIDVYWVARNSTEHVTTRRQEFFMTYGENGIYFSRGEDGK